MANKQQQPLFRVVFSAYDSPAFRTRRILADSLEEAIEQVRETLGRDFKFDFAEEIERKK